MKKFAEFTNEGIRDTFKKVKSRLKEYTDAQSKVEEPKLTPINREIEIDTDFENKISLEEYVELDLNSVSVKYDKNELIKLNLFFGKASQDEYDLGKYFFDVKNQIFGQPMYKFIGCIDKKRLVDNGIIYLLNMQIEIKDKNSSGRDWVIIKYTELQEVLEFLDTIIEK